MKRQQTKIAHCKNFAVATLNIVVLYDNGHRPNATKQVGILQKQTATFLKHVLLLSSLIIITIFYPLGMMNP